MRVHVISDMEGVAGIVKWEQVSAGEPLFEEGRRLCKEGINAGVRGAKAAGATEIVVKDGKAPARAERSTPSSRRRSTGLRARRPGRLDWGHGGSASKVALLRTMTAMALT